MATLNIGGRKVKVDDSFRQLSPEQQAATVEEIAQSIGVTQQEPPSPEFTDAMADASARSQALGRGPVTPRDEAMRGRPDLAGATAATLAGVVEGIPVVGPFLQNASDALIGAGAKLTGGDYDETVEGLRQRRAALKQANPVANIAGNLAGGIGAFGGAAKVAGGAAALGLEGTLGARVANSAVSGGGISAADAMVRDGDPLQAAALGAGMGGAIPVLGAAAGGITRAVGNKVRPAVQAVLNPADEASRQAGVAIRRDMAANPDSVMTAADEAVARQANIPLTNVDRGGETTRALARSVANQSPEARQMLQKTAEDRFVGQGGRATEFIRRLTGGNVDDLAFQQGIRDTARKVNEPRYKAAYEAPEAQAVWSPTIRQLMQSPRFLNAVRQAESRGADSAAISGFRAVKNPFEFRPDGSITLKMNKDGSRALPTLQFWNQVKRNLDGQIEAAMRGAKPDRTLVADLTQMKNMLLADLDAKIPAYQVARRGAAGFFDADDALEAGKKFANSARMVPEAKRAFAQFNAAERKAFQTGYASELIDRIMATRDRSNVIDQVFGNQARREMIKLVFGPQKAKELEAYIRVETLADQLRGALGNSTTARQLMEMGIGGAGEPNPTGYGSGQVKTDNTRLAANVYPTAPGMVPGFDTDLGVMPKFADLGTPAAATRLAVTTPQKVAPTPATRRNAVGSQLAVTPPITRTVPRPRPRPVVAAQQPLRIIVSGGNPMSIAGPSGGGSSAPQISASGAAFLQRVHSGNESGYTSLGNGAFEGIGGGIYYDRHIK